MGDQFNIMAAFSYSDDILQR